jgi:asparagine synthase (glutamine-hydrolysing)
MCGIFGAFSRKGVDLDKLNAATKAIEHRGPDSQGKYVSDDKAVGFGHTRLSIVDLLDRSNQPMHKHDLVIIFNGEVFNFKEITRELASFGYKFTTTSDTEMVLSAFDKWGVDCVKRFNGFFAFAIYDKNRKKVYAFRDRLGVKQLVYTTTGDSILFASEIKSLLNYGVKASPDIETIYSDLIFTFWGDKHNTYFKDIKHLDPGSYLEITERGLSIKKYWDININLNGFSELEEKSVDQIIEELYALLNDSVKIRLNADCKVGTLLSGGLDSSLITKIAADNNNSTVDAFTLKYDGEENEDLIKAKLLVSQSENIVHHIVNVTRDDVNLKLIDKVTYHMEEILFDKAYISIYKNYAVAKDMGIKAVLNGQGSDEVWVGYYFFYPFLQFENKLLEMNSFASYWKSNFFLNEFTDSGTTNKLVNSNLEKNYLPYLGSDHVNSVIAFAIKTHLQSMLMQEDRLSMASSVECRVPFVDYRIIELALSLSSKIKVLDGREKYLLRKVGQKLLPEEIYNRRKEVFPIPPKTYDIIGEKLIDVKEILSGNIIRSISNLSEEDFKGLSPANKWKLFALSRFEKLYF